MSDVQATTVDPAERLLQRMTPVQRVHGILHRYPALSPAVVLVLAAVVLGSLNNRFFLPSNLSLVAQQVAVVGGLAVGQTLIILTAGIDLSVGAIMVFTSIVMAGSAANFGVPGPLALVLGLLVGTLAGGLNGLLVTRLRLPPFIVTLGTLNIFTALTLLVSNGASIQGKDIPDLLQWTGLPIAIGPFRLTTGVLLMLAMYVIAT